MRLYDLHKSNIITMLSVVNMALLLLNFCVINFIILQFLWYPIVNSIYLLVYPGDIGRDR